MVQGRKKKQKGRKEGRHGASTAKEVFSLGLVVAPADALVRLFRGTSTSTWGFKDMKNIEKQKTKNRNTIYKDEYKGTQY